MRSFAKRSMFLLALVALLGGVFCSQAVADADMKVHMVVVNALGRVTVQDYEALEQMFLENAGGYTILPNTAGGSLHDGNVTREESTTYLVAAKTDISAAIKSFIADNGKFDEPFILVWDAVRK